MKLLIFTLFLFFNIIKCDKSTGYYFKSKFKMYMKNGANCGSVNKNVYYTGTMTYSYDTATKYSYREMAFDSLSNDNKVYPTETYVYAADKNDSAHPEFLLLTRCPTCSYKSLGSTYKAEILFKGATSTDNSYCIKPVFDNDDDHLKSFETSTNCFEVDPPSVKIYNGQFTVPTYFGVCYSKSCHVLMDFVLSYDFSGSMKDSHDNRFTKSIQIANKIVELFWNKDTSYDSDIQGAVIQWSNKATIAGTSNKKDVSQIESSGFSYKTNFLKDIEEFGKTTPTGGTCLICGYRAMYEVGYLQFKYEYSLRTVSDRFYKAGRVGIILTDGEATYSNEHYYSIGTPVACSKKDVSKGCPSKSGYKGWEKDTGGGSDYEDRFLTHLKTAKGLDENGNEVNTITTNARAYYASHMLEGHDFFKEFTVIAIAAYGSANNKFSSIYKLIGQRDTRLDPSFKTTYYFDLLDDGPELDKFFNSLKTNICSSIGDVSVCEDNLDHPCCEGNNYCPIDKTQENTCKKTNPSYAYGTCTYNPKCLTVDCQRYQCLDKQCVERKDVDPCKSYECKNGSLVEKGDISCTEKLSSFDSCKKYTCKSTQKISYNDYKKLNWNSYCKAGDNICTVGTDCMVTEAKNEYGSKAACTQAGYTWNNACYNIYNYNDLPDENCVVYNCVKGSPPQYSSNSVECNNMCKYCDPKTKTNECVIKPNDPCLDKEINSQYDPE